MPALLFGQATRADPLLEVQELHLTARPHHVGIVRWAGQDAVMVLSTTP